MAVLHLEQLDVEHANGAQVLHGVTLEVGDGELLVLLGDESARAVVEAVQGRAGLRVRGGSVRIGPATVNDLPAGLRDVAAVEPLSVPGTDMTVAELIGLGLAERQPGSTPTKSERGWTPPLRCWACPPTWAGRRQRWTPATGAAWPSRVRSRSEPAWS